MWLNDMKIGLFIVFDIKSTDSVKEYNKQVEGPKAAIWVSWNILLSLMTVVHVLTPKTGINLWMI